MGQQRLAYLFSLSSHSIYIVVLLLFLLLCSLHSHTVAAVINLDLCFALCDDVFREFDVLKDVGAQ